MKKSDIYSIKYNIKYKNIFALFSPRIYLVWVFGALEAVTMHNFLLSKDRWNYGQTNRSGLLLL